MWVRVECHISAHHIAFVQAKPDWGLGMRRRVCLFKWARSCVYIASQSMGHDCDHAQLVGIYTYMIRQPRARLCSDWPHTVCGVSLSEPHLGLYSCNGVMIIYTYMYMHRIFFMCLLKIVILSRLLFCGLGWLVSSILDVIVALSSWRLFQDYTAFSIRIQLACSILGQTRSMLLIS